VSSFIYRGFGKVDERTVKLSFLKLRTAQTIKQGKNPKIKSSYQTNTLTDESFVFINPKTSKPYGMTMLADMLEKYNQELGIPITPHMLPLP
jgi:hypothetical protein